MRLNYCLSGLVLFLRLLHGIATDAVSPNCTSARDFFANASSNFIKCSIEFSRPIHFCKSCVPEYIDVIDSYNNMSKISDNGTLCIDRFINLDRLDVVHNLYQNSVNLWTRAKCSDCFVIKDGKITTDISQLAANFANLYDIYEGCVNQTAEDEICTSCMDSYVALENYFLSISNENQPIGVCMDIVDRMNSTWIFWGHKCCRFRRHNEYGFILSMVTILIITVLFYVLVPMYAKKKMPTIMEQSRFVNTLDHET